MTTIVTASDNGTTITSHLGDTILVRLNENPTTGYRWQIERLDGPLELGEDSFQVSVGALIGSGGTREFRFRSTSVGTAKLELKHWQAWEGELSVTERFTIALTVAV